MLAGRERDHRPALLGELSLVVGQAYAVHVDRWSKRKDLCYGRVRPHSMRRAEHDDDRRLSVNGISSSGRFLISILRSIVAATWSANQQPASSPRPTLAVLSLWFILRCGSHMDQSHLCTGSPVMRITRRRSSGACSAASWTTSHRASACTSALRPATPSTPTWENSLSRESDGVPAAFGKRIGNVGPSFTDEFNRRRSVGHAYPEFHEVGVASSPFPQADEGAASDRCDFGRIGRSVPQREGLPFESGFQFLCVEGLPLLKLDHRTPVGPSALSAIRYIRAHRHRWERSAKRMKIGLTSSAMTPPMISGRRFSNGKCTPLSFPGRNRDGNSRRLGWVRIRGGRLNLCIPLWSTTTMAVGPDASVNASIDRRSRRFRRRKGGSAPSPRLRPRSSRYSTRDLQSLRPFVYLESDVLARHFAVGRKSEIAPFERPMT